MSARQGVEEVAAAAEKALDKIEKKPVAQQILIGAVSGLATGYILAKIGKSVAFCVGISAIGVQFFVNRNKNTSGANWKQIESDAREAVNRVIPVAGMDNTFRRRVIEIIKENRVFFGSFGGGFLVGVSFS